MDRDSLRAAAKKVYKEKTKNIPKKQRIPFAQFFKQFKKSKQLEKEVKPEVGEDFDFGDMVNVNDVDKK